MSLSLYMDENVPIAITRGLRSRNVDVLTAQEDGLTSFPDNVIFDRATELGRLVFSQDRDFLVEARRRQAEGIDFPGVIYARQFRVAVGDSVRDLKMIAKLGNPQEFANQVIYLPL